MEEGIVRGVWESLDWIGLGEEGRGRGCERDRREEIKRERIYGIVGKEVGSRDFKRRIRLESKLGDIEDM